MSTPVEHILLIISSYIDHDNRSSRSIEDGEGEWYRFQKSLRGRTEGGGKVVHNPGDVERAIISGEYRPRRFWNIRRSNGYVYIYIYTYRFGQESASLGNIEKVLTVLH